MGPRAGLSGIAAPIAAFSIALLALAATASGEHRDADVRSSARAAGLQQSTPHRIYLPWAARRDLDAPRPVDRVGGTTRALAARSDRVYAAIDDRVVAFNVSGTLEFGPVGQTDPLPSNIEALLLDGDRLYAAAGPAGLHVADLSEVDRPRWIHGIALAGSAMDLALHGDSVLVALDGGGSTLAVVETDRGRLSATGELHTGSGARALSVIDDLVYLTRTGCEIQTIRITSDPGLEPIGMVGSACAGVEAEHLARVGDFLAPSASDASQDRSTQVIWRLDDPLQPVMDDGPTILARRIGSLVEFEATVFAATHGSTGSSAADGLWIGSRPGPLGEPYGEIDGASIALSGGLRALALDPETDRLYGGGERLNLVAYDITDPRAPVETARYMNVQGAGRVAAGGDQVYVIEDQPPALGIISTDGPWPPRRTGTFALTAEDLGSDRVQLLADPKRRYAYLLYYNALQVVETTAPDAPAARRLLAMPDISHMAIDDRWIYGAGDGLRIIDVFVQDDPKQLAYVRQAGNALAVAAEGTRVYVAQREPTGGRPTSLYVWDVTDRNNPQRVGQLPDIGPTVDLAALGGFAWHLWDYSEVAGQQARGAALSTIDARNPAAVTELTGSRMVIEGRPRRLLRDASAGRLYLVEESYFDRRTREQRGRDGVHVLSIADPGRPAPVRFLPWSPPPRDIAARDGKLYLVGDRGLSIIDPVQP